MINSFLWVDVTFWLYLTSCAFYVLHGFFYKNETLGILGTVTAILGAIINTLALGYRAYEAGHAPFSNLYESMLLFTWATVIGYLMMEFKYKLRIIGTFVMSIVFFSILTIVWLLPYRYQNIDPLNPALQSLWLEIHVMTTFIGYAAFAISFGISIMYLIKNSVERGGNREGNLKGFFARFPDLNILDELNYKSIAWGFPFLTIGIITGAVWANYAWGTYWSWDPKETWSAIVWLIYAGYLHARVTHGWRGVKTAIFAIIGFLSVIFLYWGVSFLLPGLHAYA